MMRSALALAAGLAVLAMPAAATTIDFTGISGVVTNGGSTAVGQGFNVSLINASANGFIVFSNQPNVVGNGTTQLVLGNNGTVRFSEAAPSASGFGITSLDVGGSFIDLPIRWASLLTFTGTFVGGGSISSSFALDPLVTTPSTVALTGFIGLSSFSIIPTVNASGGANNFEFAVDNVVLGGNAGVVPEPSSWAMLIAGFGLVGAVMRRRRERVVA